MSAAPIWRRNAPDSASAKALALGALVLCLGLVALLIASPLAQRLDDARERAARLDARAASLEAAASARAEEAALAGPDAALVDQAQAWLADAAPVRDADAAMLDLLSSLRLLAEASDVALTSATPLEGARASALGDIAAAAALAGLQMSAAEARIVSDHEGLARFLAAVEAASPRLRAPVLDLSARSAVATAEENRLSARVVVFALSRAPEAE